MVPGTRTNRPDGIWTIASTGWHWAIKKTDERSFYEIEATRSMIMASESGPQNTDQLLFQPLGQSALARCHARDAGAKRRYKRCHIGISSQKPLRAIMGSLQTPLKLFTAKEDMPGLATPVHDVTSGTTKLQSNNAIGD